MIHFECDYTQGAHPKIIEMLAETNMEQTTGYGKDGHCERARQMILEKCRNKDAYVQFLVGGTKAITTVIAAALRPWQGVISADTGHINVHETGAIEATGHKVIALSNKDGKIAAEQIDACCREHFSSGNAEHMVQPGMVYVSNPTEYGTLYTKAELEAIGKVCRKYDLILFVDGREWLTDLAQTEMTLRLRIMPRSVMCFISVAPKQARCSGKPLSLRMSG